MNVYERQAESLPYIVYPQDEHESMRTGLALAITLLALPSVSDEDRALAVSELSGVLNRMSR